MNKKKMFIVFSGNNQRAVVAFCRFAKNYNVPFLIIAAGLTDTIYKSEYSKNIVDVRSSRELIFEDINEMLCKIITGFNLKEIVVLPSTEYLNRFLIKHKNEFNSNKIQIPLVDKNLYELVSDKYSFSIFCSSKGFIVPLEKQNPEELTFPFVIKPKTYFDSNSRVQIKPIIVYNREEFEKIKYTVDLGECYYQQYVGGRSFYLLYYISKRNEHVIFSQENIVQQADGGSIIAAIPADLHNKLIAQDYLTLFVELDFFGLIMVEVKEFNDQYYMIEANPRLWGPSQLFVDADIPIFESFVKEAGFETNIDNINSHKIKDVKYFWFGGVLENYQRRKTLTFYNYNQNKLIADLPLWLQQDIYRREDCFILFVEESLGCERLN